MQPENIQIESFQTGADAFEHIPHRRGNPGFCKNPASVRVERYGEVPQRKTLRAYCRKEPPRRFRPGDGYSPLAAADLFE